jgi:predicted transposase/invertase (TIGR01784 family)
MAKRTRRPSFEEVFTEAGIIPEWIERGVKQGREQGKDENARKVAKNLINRGQSLKDVAEITELDLATVKTLARSKS